MPQLPEFWDWEKEHTACFASLLVRRRGEGPCSGGALYEGDGPRSPGASQIRAPVNFRTSLVREMSLSLIPNCTVEASTASMYSQVHVLSPSGGGGDQYGLHNIFFATVRKFVTTRERQRPH